MLHALGRGFGRIPSKSRRSSGGGDGNVGTNRNERALAHGGGLTVEVAPVQPAHLHPKQLLPPHSPPMDSCTFGSSTSNLASKCGSGLAAAGDLAGAGGTQGGAGGAGGGGGRRLHASAKVHGSGEVVQNRMFPPQLTRRNSTSTIYLGPHDTLSDPDLDAAIRCVCAVFRAHMIEAVADTAATSSSLSSSRGGGGSGCDEAKEGVPATPAAPAAGGRRAGGDRGDRSRRGGRGLFGDSFDDGEDGAISVGLMEESWRGNDVSVFDDPPPTSEVGRWVGV